MFQLKYCFLLLIYWTCHIISLWNVSIGENFYLNKELSISYNSIFIQLLALSSLPKNMCKPLSMLKLKKKNPFLDTISYYNESFIFLLFLIDFLRNLHTPTSHFLLNLSLVIITVNNYWVNNMCQELCHLHALFHLNLLSIQWGRYH